MRDFFRYCSRNLWIGWAITILMTLVVTGNIIEIAVFVTNMYLEICSYFVPKQYAAALGVAGIVLGWWSFYKWLDREEHNNKEAASEE